MRKILIVGPAWVGDMMMAQSLFKTIKKREETAVIDVLAPDWSRALLLRMSEVRHAHALSIGHGVFGLKERYRVAQTLKQYQYDKAFILPNSWKSALIPWFIGIPKRTGFLGECRYGLLNEVHYLDKKAMPRLIDRYASLAYKKGKFLNTDVPQPSLTVREPSLHEALAKFALQKEQTHPILALCPGAEFGPSKRWPESHFAKVASQKLKEGWKVWLFGSKNDQAVSAHIQAETNQRCLDLTGKTSLGEAIDLLSLATTVVSNDSGLMHIAAALGKPMIAVYGSTDPNYTPPLGQSSRIVKLSLPCSPCFKRECPLEHHNCMRQLDPEKVLSAMDALVV